MRNPLPVVLLLLPTLSSAQVSVTELRDTCSVYGKVAKMPVAEINTHDAASSGFCIGYFKGFMSTVRGSVTEPDADGHIKQFNIKDGTTFNQGIGVFLAFVKERPEFLKEEDVVETVSTSFLVSGLATPDNVPVTCTKKPTTSDKGTTGPARRPAPEFVTINFKQAEREASRRGLFPLPSSARLWLACHRKCAE